VGRLWSFACSLLARTRGAESAACARGEGEGDSEGVGVSEAEIEPPALLLPPSAARPERSL
jgi:hypothetical protein